MTRDEIELLQRTKLKSLLREVLQSNAFYRQKLGGIDPDLPVSALPFTTREEIQNDQITHPPYGSNLTFPVDRYTRLHETSGSMGRKLRILDRFEDWQWWKKCWREIFTAAGVSANDRIAFPFSFGPFIGFWAAFEGAIEHGAMCLAAGGMSTHARLDYIIDNKVTTICCTPTYAMHMAEAASARGLDLNNSTVKHLIVAGEPGGSIPSVRNKIETSWGARVFDHAGMTEIGPHSFECIERPLGLHVIESEFIAEVIDPQTLKPLNEGQLGELVLTNLGRYGYPLLRYRTGDLVRLTRGKCKCGRDTAWLDGGLLGRIDDMVTIRGNNVFPTAVEAILREIPGIVEYRVRILQAGALCEMEIEVESEAALDEQVAHAIRDRLNFRPSVKRVPSGTLPRFEMKARRWERVTGS